MPARKWDLCIHRSDVTYMSHQASKEQMHQQFGSEHVHHGTQMMDDNCHSKYSLRKKEMRTALGGAVKESHAKRRSVHWHRSSSSSPLSSSSSLSQAATPHRYRNRSGVTSTFIHSWLPFICTNKHFFFSEFQCSVQSAAKTNNNCSAHHSGHRSSWRRHYFSSRWFIENLVAVTVVLL